jgi:hypothetical protein
MAVCKSAKAIPEILTLHWLIVLMVPEIQQLPTICAFWHCVA